MTHVAHVYQNQESCATDNDDPQLDWHITSWSDDGFMLSNCDTFTINRGEHQ